jgi:hypothetical protein
MSAQGGGGGKSRWGSLLSQAVAGVEARLDTILAEEDQPKPAPSPTPSQQSRTSTGMLSIYSWNGQEAVT